MQIMCLIVACDVLTLFYPLQMVKKIVSIGKGASTLFVYSFALNRKYCMCCNRILMICTVGLYTLLHRSYSRMCLSKVNRCFVVVHIHNRNLYGRMDFYTPPPLQKVFGFCWGKLRVTLINTFACLYHQCVLGFSIDLHFLFAGFFETPFLHAAGAVRGSRSTNK